MTCRMLIALFALSVVRYAYAVPPITSDDVGRAVETARTATDHNALASYFESKARSAQAEADAQRELATRYRRTAGSNVFRAHHWNLARTMQPLCQALVKSLEGASRQYSAIAAKHRLAARELE